MGEKQIRKKVGKKILFKKKVRKKKKKKKVRHREGSGASERRNGDTKGLMERGGKKTKNMKVILSLFHLHFPQTIILHF